MNNIIPQLQPLSPTDVTYSKDGNHTTYNTNYDVFGADGSLTGSYRRQSCFVEIFINDNTFIENKDKYSKLVMYALEEDSRLTNKEIKKYITYLKTLGIAFKFTENVKYNLNYVTLSKEDTNKMTLSNMAQYESRPGEKFLNSLSSRVIEGATEIPCFKEQTVYSIEIDLTKVKTLLEVKLIAYLFRYIYEFDHDYILKMALEYKKTYKHTSLFQILAIFMNKGCSYPVPEKDSINNRLIAKMGHELFRYPTIDITTKRIKELLVKNKSNITDLGAFWTLFPQIKASYKCTWGKQCTYIKEIINLDTSIANYIKYILDPKNINTVAIINKYVEITVIKPE